MKFDELNNYCGNARAYVYCALTGTSQMRIVSAVDADIKLFTKGKRALTENLSQCLRLTKKKAYVRSVELRRTERDKKEKKRKSVILFTKGCLGPACDVITLMVSHLEEVLGDVQQGGRLGHVSLL